MSTQEIAKTLVDLCSKGKFIEAGKTLYSPDIVSVEASAPAGQSRETKGLQNVVAKSESFLARHELHSITVEGPLVAGSYFAVTFKLDMTAKQENRRYQVEEIALYKVGNGKIVREEFFYGM
jgi:ketosteroid isomerase-like protein